MSRIVLDTHVYAAYMQGDSRVLDAFGKAEQILISVVVMGELYAGFRAGSKYQENKTKLQQFLQKKSVAVLHITAETAEIFGRIKNQLRVAGTPIPLNDIWISAQAIETGSQMVTYDHYFSHVAELRLWDPVDLEGEV